MTKRSAILDVGAFQQLSPATRMNRPYTSCIGGFDTFVDVIRDIFVNDGSPDNSADRILRFRRQTRTFGITHSRNFGSQMAFRSGMQMSVMLRRFSTAISRSPELTSSFIIDGLTATMLFTGDASRDMPFVWSVYTKPSIGSSRC
jgi:hypothetical protein